MPKEKICPVSEVRVSIPRVKLIQLYYGTRALVESQSVEMRGLLHRIEKKIIMLQHIESVTRKILLRE
jgi:hypothetical protein